MIKAEIIVEEEKWQEEIPKIEPFAIDISKKAYEFAKSNEDIKFKIEKPAIFSLLLTNDETIQQINREYRGIDKPTNVLSFAYLDSNSNEIEKAQELAFNEVMLGDIAISFETTQKEAIEQKKSIQNHFAHLIIHGVLHLLGFDHIEDNQALIMENLEINILDDLNISNPYNY